VETQGREMNNNDDNNISGEEQQEEEEDVNNALESNESGLVKNDSKEESSLFLAMLPSEIHQ